VIPTNRLPHDFITVEIDHSKALVDPPGYTHLGDLIFLRLRFGSEEFMHLAYGLETA